MVEGPQGAHRKGGSKKMSQSTMVYAGIDTGKRTLDVAIHGAKARSQVANDEAGHTKLVAWLHHHRVRRAGIEASGGYEQAIVARLRHDGFEVIVFQPAQVRAYAQFRLQRAKNDRIDAALIATCTAACETIHAPPDPRLAARAEHLTLIEQITEDIARLEIRRSSCRNPDIRHRWDPEIQRLRQWLKRELAELVADLRLHPDLAMRLDLIESVPGIGLRTAVAILVRMPEIGSLSPEQAAALAGLAPYDQDSGDHRGERHIAGGRKRLRNSLYAAAFPAAFRWNSHLIALYQRITAKGKPHKLALTACARKLLLFANAVVARGSPWLHKTNET
jgi:transposase